MKSIMLSIQPKYCELIASGKKTVEVRKTAPKLEVPFKCYIYQTRRKWIYRLLKKLGLYRGKVIGEFVCDYIDECIPDYNPIMHKFFNYCFYGKDGMGLEDCLTAEELERYGNGKPLHGWHITDLKIYDKPKEPGEFSTVDMNAVKNCKYRERVYVNPDFVNGANLKCGYVCNKDEIDWCCKCLMKPLTRPPQSWCYVEELK